jgi:hypothetical protein
MKTYRTYIWLASAFAVLLIAGPALAQTNYSSAKVMGVDNPDGCLRIRSGPGSTYSIVGCSSLGDTVRLTGKYSQEWAEIDRPIAGWVYGPQVGQLPPRTYANTYAPTIEENYVTGPPTVYAPSYGYYSYGYPRYWGNYGYRRGYRPYYGHSFYSGHGGPHVRVGRGGVSVRAAGVGVRVGPHGGFRGRGR